MIVQAIQNLPEAGQEPTLSKECAEYLQTVFTFEYLKMAGIIDRMREHGQSEAFINGYIEGVYSAFQRIEMIYNRNDQFE
ncbi:TPA: phage protein [Kluyvera georgiana]